MTKNEKVYRKRLLKLAEKLESLPKKRFYYGDWVGEDWRGKKDLSCGTTACALGWATTIPSLRREGLRLFKHDYSNGGYVGLIDKKGKETGDEIDAGKKVFGLNSMEVGLLFYPGSTALINGHEMESPDEDATPKQVAKFIRKFVEYRYGE